jgi:hypothetical protein
MGLRTAQLGPAYSPAGSAVPAAHVLAEGEAGVGDASVLSAEAGTTFVAWTSLPVGGSAAGAGLHLQRLAGDGAPDPAWPAGGARVCASALGRGAPRVVAQADSGVIVAWEDYRNGSSDIFAQRIDAAGAVAPGWTQDGVAVCAAAGEQYAPSLIADGAGGVLATWLDAGASAGASFFAMRPAGNELATLAVATALPGHAHVEWRVAEVLGGTLAVERRVGADGTWLHLSAVAPDDSNRVVVDDRTAPEGSRVEYRLALRGEGFVQYLPSVALEIPVAPVRLALHRAWAVSSQNLIVLSLALPRGAAPVVELLDVMGRRLERQVFGGLEPGEQTVRLHVPDHLASGVYFLRLVQGPEARSAKVVFIR